MASEATIISSTFLIHLAASRIQDWRIAVQNKTERRRRRQQRAEVQQQKLQSDLEREKREAVERENSRVRKQLDHVRDQQYENVVEHLSCANADGQITCLPPSSATLDPTANTTSTLPSASGNTITSSPFTWAVVGILICLLGSLALYSRWLYHDSKKSAEAKIGDLRDTVTATRLRAQRTGSANDKIAAKKSRLERNLAEVNGSLDITRDQLQRSERALKEMTSNNEGLERNLATVKESCDHITQQLRVAEQDRDKHITDSKTKQQELAECQAQLNSMRQEMTGYRLANCTSTTANQRLESNLADVMRSLEHTKNLLNNADSKLSSAERKAEQDLVDAEKSAMQAAGKRQRAHLACKYFLLWQLRVRARAVVRAATTTPHVTDGAEEREPGDGDDHAEPRDEEFDEGEVKEEYGDRSGDSSNGEGVDDHEQAPQIFGPGSCAQDNEPGRKRKRRRQRGKYTKQNARERRRLEKEEIAAAAASMHWTNQTLADSAQTASDSAAPGPHQQFHPQPNGLDAEHDDTDPHQSRSPAPQRTFGGAANPFEPGYGS